MDCVFNSKLVPSLSFLNLIFLTGEFGASMMVYTPLPVLFQPSTVQPAADLNDGIWASHNPGKPIIPFCTHAAPQALSQSEEYLCGTAAKLHSICHKALEDTVQKHLDDQKQALTRITQDHNVTF